MSIFRFSKGSISPVDSVTFSQIGWSERADFQALLRDHIEVIVPDGMVVSEEFSNWKEGKRRIDLLVVDRNRNLVVVELKRTDDGGHMELQALRYAAMISRMNYEQLVAAYEAYLEAREQDPASAQATLSEWFGPESEEGTAFPAGVRICLVGADFSKEITTTALWLRDQGVDISCVRFKPYRVKDELIAEVERVIPPPDTDALVVAPGSRERSARKPWIRMPIDDVFGAMAPGAATVATRLREWLLLQKATIFTTANGFAPKFQMEEFPLYPFKVRKDGRVVVWFSYLKNRKPFDSRAKRRELLERLNRIPGVHVDERLEGRPSFPLTALSTPGAFQAFADAIAWTVDEVRAATAPDGRSESELPG